MNRVEDLTPEQLRDEVWFWRAEAAAETFSLAHDLKASAAGGTHRSRSRIAARLTALTLVLDQALTGEYHDPCFACGFPIRPGDAVISDVEEGEMHAQCPIEGRAVTIRPGDKVFMDPEGIVWEGEGPKPDHIVAHEASRPYTHEQLVEALRRGREALARGKPVR